MNAHPEIVPSLVAGIERKCVRCGERFKVTQGQRSGKYCAKCQFGPEISRRFHISTDAWRAGTVTPVFL
jgi:hypothetical protein